MLTDVLAGLFTLENLLSINMGLAGGIIIGALPGLTATMGLALLLPVTYGLNPITGVLLLLGVYCGAIYGGSITAILIKTPGTPSAAATVLDGHELAKKGQAGAALEMALKASLFGGIFSAILLLFTAPLLANFALKFGPPEYFALAVFGLTIISSLGGESVFKGLLMGMIGLFATTIGMDPINGIVRLTFGIDALWGGINVIPAMIGLFAVSEILQKSMTVFNPIEKAANFAKTTLPFKEFIKYWRTLIKSSVIGSFIGAIPGTGAAIAAFISYNEAKRSSKTPELFGTGHLDGVAAPEAANNAVTGSAMIPLLTLGIPGDSVTAILMGALIMQGIVPGPQLFIEKREWVYIIMIGLIVINIFMFFQGKLFIKSFVNITKLPITILIPVLMVLCVIGAYAVNNNITDVFIMLGFGMLAHILTRYGFPITPMVIAIVLGPLAEQNLRRSLILSEGSASIFFMRPISLVFIILSVFMVVLPMIQKMRKSMAR